MEMIEAVKILGVYGRRIWIEEDICGTKHVMIQHQDGKTEPFTYCSFFYDHRYTGNSTVFEAAKRLALSLGATEPVLVKRREFSIPVINIEGTGV